MFKRFAIRFFFAFLLCFGASRWASADQAQSPAAFVRALLDAAPADMDFGRAKLAVDRFVDPSIDETAALAELDRMAATVNQMLATLPPEAAAKSAEKLQALRTFLYEGGWWNNGRPYRYDLSDPYGQKPGTQSLPNYLVTRQGNCVSMPMLFLALGERLGLRLTLSTAPVHLFVKWTDDSGTTWNLETTSGAGFTRDAYYRKVAPMTDEAVANGVYLKTLSRREALSVVATGVLDGLLANARYEDAIAVADLLVEAWPADAYVLVKQGTAYYRLLERDFIKKYPKRGDIPADEIAHADDLYRANQDAFARAEALGWREPKLD